jgi:hypothetical protein
MSVSLCVCGNECTEYMLANVCVSRFMCMALHVGITQVA